MSSVEQKQWNDPEVGERMRRLKHYVSQYPLVEDVTLFPGGALDAAHIDLVTTSMTLPDHVIGEIRDRDLSIRSYSGKIVQVADRDLEHAYETAGIEVSDT